VSTVPTQALTLLNNEFTLIQANRFSDASWQAAGRMRKRSKRAVPNRLSREPSESECA